VTSRIVRFDDMTGEPDAHEVRFGLEGREYVIDLADGNARELMTILAPYIKAARLSSRIVPPPKSRPQRTTRSADVRVWARDNGYAVNNVGAIAAHVARAYNEAHAG
jgi:hypothetical protein